MAKYASIAHEGVKKWLPSEPLSDERNLKTGMLCKSRITRESHWLRGMYCSIRASFEHKGDAQAMLWNDEISQSPTSRACAKRHTVMNPIPPCSSQSFKYAIPTIIQDHIPDPSTDETNVHFA
jgi:hypothetical protein